MTVINRFPNAAYWQGKWSVVCSSWCSALPSCVYAFYKHPVMIDINFLVSFKYVLIIDQICLVSMQLVSHDSLANGYRP